MRLKPIALIAGAACIVLLNAGCGQKADAPISSQVTQTSGPATLTPEQQVQKDTWDKNQEAMMKAQAQAHPPGSK